MKLLCICPIGIGNYLLCYPAWVQLRKRLPDVQLHLCALRKQIVDLADADPLWSGIHLIEPTKKPGMLKIARFIILLMRQRFYASIAFFPANTWHYNLLPFLAGIGKRYVFAYRCRKFATLSWLATDLIPVNDALHDVMQNCAIAGRFTGTGLSDEEVVFPELVTGGDFNRLDSLLPQGAVFALHPGSSVEHGMDAKRWAPERFGKLADKIAKKLNATVLIIGGADEAALKQATAEEMTMPCRCLDPLPFSLTSALLKRSHLCLCNDSGIMHLAACSGTPVIALFGPTDERRNGPYGDFHCIIRKSLPGFPLWTAANVGVRAVPPGVNPLRPLLELTVDDAWDQCASFVEKIASNLCSNS